MFDPIDFILNASGLYVPPLIGLAVNPLGRFQPCPSESCCEGVSCNHCADNTMSESYEAVIDGVTNTACSTCVSEHNKTFILDQPVLACGMGFETDFGGFCMTRITLEVEFLLFLGEYFTYVRMRDYDFEGEFEELVRLWVFRKSYATSLIPCEVISGEDIPLLSYQDFAGGECGGGSTTCTLTAL